MLFKMHCHTSEKSKCSSVPAVDLIRRVHARGLQGIVLTDHHAIWTEEELTTVRHQAGVPDHFLIMSAQEVTTKAHGDVLVYGASEAIAKGTQLFRARTNLSIAAFLIRVGMGDSEDLWRVLVEAEQSLSQV
jgi:predicted metal-dependent phosphoesterase TrpH